MRLPLYTWILLIVIAVTGGLAAHLLAGETPYGRLDGVLVAADTGLPLGKVAVNMVAGTDTSSRYRTKTDALGRFRFTHLPTGAYRVMAETKAHGQSATPITIQEGKTTVATFELQPTDPFLQIFQGQHLFTTREAPKLRVHGFVPTSALAVQVYRIADQARLQLGWWGDNTLMLDGRQVQYASLETIPQLSLLQRTDLPIGEKDRDSEGVFRTEVVTAKLPPGSYLVAVEARELRKMVSITVTDLGLIVKSAPTQMLVYAVDMVTGAAAAATDVRVLDDSKLIAYGRTGADGLALLSTPTLEAGSQLQVIGKKGDSTATSEFYRYWYEEHSSLRMYTYTDRPVYRPGHTVSYKSILREVQGDAYRAPVGELASVRVMDERENVLYTRQLRTNDYGSVSGEVTLPEDALPGSYTITVKAKGVQEAAYFSVNEYRKPEYEVDILTPRKRYHRGESFPATIVARYFYGAPVPNAQVNYYVTRSPYWYAGDGDDWNADVGLPGYGADGEYITYGSGRTNAAGQLEIMIPAQAEQQGAPAGEDWHYVISADVSDDSGRAESGSAAVLVTQGAFRLQAEVDPWVASPDQPVAVNIRAIDYAGRPVKTSGSLTFARADWQDGRERLRNPQTQSWRTDAEGKASVTITPRSSGDYRVVLNGRDTQRNQITATSYLWVMEGEYAAFSYPYQDLDVKADRDLYKEGDTAQIVVNTRHAPITALLTIEGAGLLEHRLVTLRDKSTILPVQVDARFMPAVQASVCFLKGKKFFSGDAAINVSREKKALQVEVTSDAQHYLPGAEATYRVKTMTPDGTPAQAEVSLGLVDESIYRIAPDTVENIVSYFYPRREHTVQTSISFPEIYLSGDNKSGAQIATRRRFLDTAFWNPTVVTDKEGMASITVTLPDNLTTWRATCRAATRDTRVGQATSTAIVQKPFLVRLEPPRFLTQGDRVRIAAVAHNLSGKPLIADLGLNVKGLRLRGDAERRASVKAGETVRLEWEAEVRDFGTATIRAWGKAGALDDAMELTLPVLPRGREQTETQRGTVASAADLRFTLHDAYIPDTQQLSVRLAPSLASALLGSLEYLAAYPYGCVEQTMSCFLPDIVIKEMLDTLQIDNPQLDRELPKMVQAGLLKLYAMQHDDGGWGWWKYDQSDAWMTAYVVFGLAKAKAAGYEVNARALQDGIDALARYYRGEQQREDERGFAAYALATAGQIELARQLTGHYLSAQGAARLARMSDWQQLMLAQALMLTGEADSGRAIVNRVWGRFDTGKITASGARWTEMDEAGALLCAAASLMPDDTRLPQLVQWLMQQRQGNHWHSTRDTAFILYGFSRYLQHTRELQPDMTVKVLLNGRQVATRTFTRADIFQPEFTLMLKASDLGGQHPELRIERTGSGQLYYTASFKQSVALDSGTMRQSSAPFSVERQYRKVRRDVAGRATAGAQAGPPQTAFRRGDVIEVTLTVRSQERQAYLLLEDPLPAGCEVQDRGAVSRWEWGNWWSNQIIRDEKVSFPLREIEPGANRITYYLIAQVPGVYTALPPRVFDMYRPEMQDDGSGQTITIR